MSRLTREEKEIINEINLDDYNASVKVIKEYVNSGRNNADANCVILDGQFRLKDLVKKGEIR